MIKVGHLRRLSRRKKRLFKHAKQLNTEESWNAFKVARTVYQSEIKTAKSNYDNNKFQKLADSGSRNSKKWWSLLKQVYENNDISVSIPPLEVNGTMINDDKEKAEAFNTFFLSVTSLDEVGKELPNDPAILNINSLVSLHVSENDVQDQLQCLDVNKSYGPDGISPKLLKEAGNTITKSLQICLIYH